MDTQGSRRISAFRAGNTTSTAENQHTTGRGLGYDRSGSDEHKLPNKATHTTGRGLRHDRSGTAEHKLRNLAHTRPVGNRATTGRQPDDQLKHHSRNPHDWSGQGTRPVVKTTSSPVPTDQLLTNFREPKHQLIELKSNTQLDHKTSSSKHQRSTRSNQGNPYKYQIKTHQKSDFTCINHLPFHTPNSIPCKPNNQERFMAT